MFGGHKEASGAGVEGARQESLETSRGSLDKALKVVIRTDELGSHGRV